MLRGLFIVLLVIGALSFGLILGMQIEEGSQRLMRIQEECGGLEEPDFAECKLAFEQDMR